MEQSKVESGIEVVVDVGSGLLVSWVMQMYFIPLIYPSYQLTGRESLFIVIMFTVLSVLRKFYWRRFFARGFHLIVHKYITRLFV